DPDNIDIKMKSVPMVSKEKLPVPYILSNEKCALLIVGNPTEQEVKLELEITPERLDLPIGTKLVKVSELWPAEHSVCRLTAEELSHYKIKVPADGIPGGGLAVLRFELE
ncbi:MAG: hypothetical protein KAW56_01615, partial [Candidatus Marinimicrobia bacterium]|nr:hypothetical protein [Candidatus Neomarinimicrobiota bacterium]